jgi:hypothetical protein
MGGSYLKTTEFFVLVLWLGCATGESDGKGTSMKRNQDFFLKQIFDKYGDHGVITFEVNKKKTSSDVRTDNSYIRFVEGAFDWVKETEENEGPARNISPFPSVPFFRNNIPSKIQLLRDVRP